MILHVQKRTDSIRHVFVWLSFRSAWLCEWILRRQISFFLPFWLIHKEYMSSCAPSGCELKKSQTYQNNCRHCRQAISETFPKSTLFNTGFYTDSTRHALGPLSWRKWSITLVGTGVGWTKFSIIVSNVSFTIGATTMAKPPSGLCRKESNHLSKH